MGPHKESYLRRGPSILLPLVHPLSVLVQLHQILLVASPCPWSSPLVVGLLVVWGEQRLSYYPVNRHGVGL